MENNCSLEGASVAAQTCGAVVPAASGALITPVDVAAGAVTVVADVRGYLTARTPVAKWDLEQPLFARLPAEVRSAVKQLQAACLYVRSLTAKPHKLSVQRACERALMVYPRFRPRTTFRGKYDAWQKQQDWLVFVNRAKAGAPWQCGQRGLPDQFLDYVVQRMGDFKRHDAGEQAILSLHRQWETGRNHRGIAEPVPGYEQGWDTRQRALLPAGWAVSNIRREIKRRAKFTRAVKALRHEGIAAARSHLPQVHGTRRELRFLEQVQFDDVRCDFRVMDTDSGQVNDLWLLVARDVATTMLLGFGMRPARARDDGSQEHLKLQDMKQLCGWLLETYGLPPYPMTWVIENGTATLSEAVAQALDEMIGGERIQVRYASMIGGRSSTGYAERAVGNSKAKAMLESLNRLQHMLTSHFPGQIGLNYSKLPAESRAREAEARQIWESHRPEDRAELHYPFYTLPQARAALFEVFGIQNRRDEHDCEGFRQIAEWFDGQRWQPQHTAPADMTGIRTRTRMEAPIERAAWLLRDCAPFDHVSPEILTVFYERSQRKCLVTESGEINLTLEGKLLRFAPPSPEWAQAPGAKLLAYFNPDDPRFLTLTDGRGGVVGTWVRRGLIAAGDREALAAAIRYSQHALKQAKTQATELAAGENLQLARMREHNGGFVTVTDATQPAGKTISSPVASAVRAVAGAKAESQKAAAEAADYRKLAREALGGI